MRAVARSLAWLIGPMVYLVLVPAPAARHTMYSVLVPGSCGKFHIWMEWFISSGGGFSALFCKDPGKLYNRSQGTVSKTARVWRAP